MPTPETLSPHELMDMSPLSRVRLGGSEAAVCGAFDLAPHGPEGGSEARIVIMDVGFRSTPDGKFGPYDLDGSGEKRTFSKNYVLVSQQETPEGPRTFYDEIESNVTYELGRQSDIARNLGYSGSNKISRKHAELFINGDSGFITLKDEGSLNGTGRPVNLKEALKKERDSNFDYTVNIRENVSSGKSHYYKSPEEEAGWGYGMYSGRPIIARDTPINGGVYPVGHKDGEALVVDDVKYPEAYNRAFTRLEQRLQNIGGDHLIIDGLRRKPISSREQRILGAIFDEVSATLRYDLAATDAMASNGTKIELSSYMNEGVGVCRTQAVLCAYFTERLINDGRLEGRVSIDRNMSETVEGERGGHAWARYASPNGQVFIIDPAQRFVGTLSEAQHNPKSWDYRRTEDLVSELLAA